MYREYTNDAGVNLQFVNNVVLKPGANIVPLEEVDFTTEYHQAFIIPRSGTFKRGILVNTTLVDSGFKGRPMLQAYNMTDHLICFEKGDSICQMVYFDIIITPQMPPAKNNRPRGKK